MYSNRNRRGVSPHRPRGASDVRHLPARRQRQLRHLADRALLRPEHAHHLPLASSARSTRAGAHSKTYHDIDQVPVNVRYPQVRQDRGVFANERAVVVARVREEHVADEELGVRPRRGAQEAEHPMMVYA